MFPLPSRASLTSLDELQLPSAKTEHSLWQRLNTPMDVPHLVLRTITGLALPTIVIVSILRYDPLHPELLFIQFGNLFWALIGFLFASRISPTFFRIYMMTFGIYMPLSNMLWNHISGFTLSGQMLTVYTCFLGMLFLQAAWDYIIVSVCILGTTVMLIYNGVIPGLNMSVWVMMFSSLVAGSMVGLMRQLYTLQLVATRDTLSRARDEALEASRLKSHFLANISHELRTPMNAIVGLSELLMHTDLNRDQKSDIQLIRESSEDLLEIVNDILDFSKIEANTLSLRMSWFHLEKVLERSLKPLQAIAMRKDLTLQWEIRPEVPLQVKGDPVRLRQILNNIVGNAIKFTNEGSIQVSVSLDEKLHDRVQLAFAVKDSGIGIPYSKQSTIFAAFVQGEGGLDREFGGTGLGLSISSNLVEMMGGHLWVTSNLGKGSTFTFTLQLDYQNESNAVIATPPPPSLPASTALLEEEALSILLAEDNPVNQTVARKALEQAGHRVTAVFDGDEAFEELQHSSFDVVLMDLQMPRCDGLSATRKVRAWEKKHDKPRIPIIALTAHASDDEVQQCLRTGMDAHLAKPFRRQELLKLIQQIKETHS